MGAVLAACSTTQSISPVEQDPAGFAAWTTEPAEYRLGAGDRLRVEYRLTPENNGELIVAPDGYVASAVTGRVRAQGLRVDELEAALVAAAGRHLINPELVASLTEARAARIVVGGAVQKPGVYPIPPRATVLEAVMLAGGLQPESRMDEVVILRVRADGRPSLRTIDLRRFVSRGAASENIELRSEDLVFVPRTRIAEINLWVEQYINRTLPFGRSVNLTRTVGGGYTP
ncbi:polysaccharide export protein [Phenylobacterium sp. J426]|uniref:polysaccharide biosynthesis/export family protein n=1 Tax=Phenylobacterium sp. J426 TaxID=2898439 RepID=UPI002151888A|nr:polysaccharide biosynthesis/export family protein [Phenylobacterium sp. J426]MCR5876632.1 polysaccharide export protein [Phenylobacterium sp. J426]